MGKIRVKIISIILMLTLLLTACGGQKESSEEEAAPKNTSEAVKEQDKDKTKDEIPADLLPEQNESGENTSSDVMEIVEEDGTVHKTESAEKTKGNSGKSENGKDSQTSGSSQAGNSGNKEDSQKVIEISFTIDSSKADGSVSYSAVMTLDAGSTVYDALAASGVSHSGKSYVSAIGGLSEGMFGAQSGWKYYVNGSAPNTGCVNYTLKDGDSVQWIYVLKA